MQIQWHLFWLKSFLPSYSSGVTRMARHHRSRPSFPPPPLWSTLLGSKPLILFALPLSHIYISLPALSTELISAHLQCCFLKAFNALALGLASHYLMDLGSSTFWELGVEGQETFFLFLFCLFSFGVCRMWLSSWHFPWGSLLDPRGKRKMFWINSHSHLDIQFKSGVGREWLAEKLVLLRRWWCVLFSSCSHGLYQDLTPEPLQAYRLSICPWTEWGHEPHLGLCEGFLPCLLGSAPGVWEWGGLPPATQSVAPVSGCTWCGRNHQT